MYIVSTIAAPGNLSPLLVENLCSAWGGINLCWLSPNEAAEFSLNTKPRNFWTVWSDFQKLKTDLVFLPNTRRRKNLLLADMDSTMIQQECIDELAKVAGVGDAIRSITKQAMNGTLDFETALSKRVAQLKDQPRTIINDVLNNQITYAPGAKTLIDTIKAQGTYTALVSGGFTAFSQPVASYLGFDEHHANTLLYHNNTLTGKVSQPILGQQAKVNVMERLMHEKNIDADAVIAVGDGANDLPMLGRAGIGVAMHAKPIVQQSCDVRINHADLRALLFLQGYSIDEFLT